MFDTPDASGDLFVNADHCGELLVVKVTGVDNIQTKASEKPSDVILGDITVINPDGTVGEKFEGATLFGRMVYGSLRRKVGRTVVGVFNGEPGKKRDGKNVAYTFDEPTPEQIKLAVQAMTDKPDPAPVGAGASSDAPPWER